MGKSIYYHHCILFEAFGDNLFLHINSFRYYACYLYTGSSIEEDSCNVGNYACYAAKNNIGKGSW